MATTATNSRVFRFLDLPAELQLHIIDFAVTLPHPIELPTKDLRSHVEQPPITKVSRNIRADALASYYKNNTFVLKVCAMRVLSSASKWLVAIGLDNRQLLRALIAKGSCCGCGERVVRGILEAWFGELGAEFENVTELEYRVTFP